MKVVEINFVKKHFLNEEWIELCNQLNVNYLDDYIEQEVAVNEGNMLCEDGMLEKSNFSKTSWNNVCRQFNVPNFEEEICFSFNLDYDDFDDRDFDSEDEDMYGECEY